MSFSQEMFPLEEEEFEVPELAELGMEEELEAPGLEEDMLPDEGFGVPGLEEDILPDEGATYPNWKRIYSRMKGLERLV